MLTSFDGRGNGALPPVFVQRGKIWKRRSGMQLKTMDNESLMDVLAIRQHGNDLLIEGRIMGALPIRAVLTPDQARAALKLLNIRTVLFLLTLLFRRGAVRG
jgi:hypothetical protein